MRRGDIVTVAISGDLGKPRPALVMQADRYNAVETVTVLLITSTMADSPMIRITITPNPSNGLQKPSQIQIDKAMTVRKERVGSVIGRLDDGTLLEVTRAFALFVGIA